MYIPYLVVIYICTCVCIHVFAYPRGRLVHRDLLYADPCDDAQMCSVHERGCAYTQVTVNQKPKRAHLVSCCPRLTDFSNFSKYGMNDLTATIKSYLRRLPDPLVNSRVCDALIHIHECEFVSVFVCVCVCVCVC